MTRRKIKPVLDVTAILNRPIAVRRGNILSSMHPYEALWRQTVGRALEGDMRAAKRFIKECIKFGILEKPEPVDDHMGVLHRPNHWDRDEWDKMFTLHGMPPWPGPDDGFTQEQREQFAGRRRRGLR